MNEKDEAFLTEYAALCEKHGIIVHGCGCCDSPYLLTVSDEYPIDKHIKHLRDRS